MCCDTISSHFMNEYAYPVLHCAEHQWDICKYDQCCWWRHGKCEFIYKSSVDSFTKASNAEFWYFLSLVIQIFRTKIRVASDLIRHGAIVTSLQWHRGITYDVFGFRFHQSPRLSKFDHDNIVTILQTTFSDAFLYGSFLFWVEADPH